MTGLGFTGNIVVILVLLLVIGMTWLLLRHRLAQTAASSQRKRADRGKVKCYAVEHFVGSIDMQRCKNKAGWVTPHGYFCDDHWEKNSLRDGTRVRWANKLAWKRMEGDAWTT